MDVYSFEEMTKLNEEAFRTRALIPLLRNLGFTEVKDWHGGSAEQGKDIICWQPDAIGHRRNLAIVAKAVTFGSNSARQDVCAQTSQSLNLTFPDKTTGEEHIVHDCWIVTNKNIAVGNNKLIRGILGPTVNPRIKILDGRDVWELLEKHFPIELNRSIHYVSERINEGKFATQLILGAVERPFFRITSGERSVIFGERYPGQLESELSETSITVSGTAISFPQGMIEQASTMLGPIPDDFNELSTPIPQVKHRFLLSIDISPDFGNTISLPYLDMIEESRSVDLITYTNDHQPIPIRVTLRIAPSTKGVTWSADLKPIPVSAPLYLHYLQFIAAGDIAGEASLTILDPGLPWGKMRIPGRSTPEITPEIIDWVSDLAQVQLRTGCPINIPDRELQESEVDSIRFLRYLLRDPVVPQTWTTGEVAFQWSADEAVEMLVTFTRSNEFRFRVVESQTFDLFGSEIPLGEVERVFTHVRLGNEDEIRSKIEELKDGDAEFVVILEPGSTNDAEARFLDWGALTKEEEESLIAEPQGNAKNVADVLVGNDAPGS